MDLYDHPHTNNTATIVRRALTLLLAIAAIALLIAPLLILDLDNAGRPDEAGPGWQALRDWSAATRNNNPTAATDVEPYLNEIRNNTGERWLTATDGDRCWALNADNPTPLPIVEDADVCTNSTPIQP